ncbi:hypothetical protein O3M35_006112 [Rhynocoris fuscipes]|uniref:Uncharacterized protein n=1 Tax=Rhynocoris fuscipes TaxID=488301 RepID=A0AAW1DC28_9HEMI
MDDPVLEQHFVGHKGSVTSLSFSPSGKQLLSSSEDHTFMNWNLNSSSGSLRYKAKPLPISCVCFSPNGNLIASTQGEFVRLWVSTIRGKSTEFKAHFSIVRSVQFSPDNSHFLTASDDKSLKIWVTAKRKFLSSLSGNGGHTNWVRFGTYSSDGHLIASCSDDKTIKLWDPVTSKLIHTFHEVRGVPRNINFHPSDGCIGIAMATGTVKIYDLKMMKLLQYYPCHDGPVNSISFHPNGSYLISAGNDSTSKVIDLIEGRAILSLEGHKKAVTAVTFSKTGKNFATGSADRNVFVWRTNLNEDNWESSNKSMKESFCDDSVSIPRLNTSHFGNIKESRISKEVYCAKDYEDNLKLDVDTTELSCEDSKSYKSEEDMKNYKSEETVNLSNDDVNPISHSINELMSQVAFLTNKLTDMELRLTQMEELIKSSKSV